MRTSYRKSTLKEFIKRYLEIYNILQIKWLEKRTWKKYAIYHKQRLGFIINKGPYRKSKVKGLIAAQIIKLSMKKNQWSNMVRKVWNKSNGTFWRIYFTLNNIIVKSDALYSATSENIPENFQTVKRFQNKISIMTWAEASKNRKLSPKFIDGEVKIKTEYYK